MKMDLKTGGIANTQKYDVVPRKHRHFAKAEMTVRRRDTQWTHKFRPNDDGQMSLHLLVFCVKDVSLHSPLKQAARG